MQVERITYKNNDFILNKYNERKEFVCLDNIIKINDDVCFVERECLTNYFNTHLNCYDVYISKNTVAIRQCDLQLPWPLLNAKISMNRFSIILLSLPEVDEII